MLKTKENSKSKKSQFIKIGSLLIFIGAIIFSSKYISNYLLYKDEKDKIQDFYETLNEEIANENKEDLKEEQKQIIKEKPNYIALIKIPKIKLEKGLYEKGSLFNNVNKNIQILKESNYPDVSNGNFILAGHSGNSKISYFKNINKLSLDDEVIILYKTKEYRYKVVNKYEIEKKGAAEIIRNKEKTTLTLITCKNNTNKQIVVICELI